FAAFIKAFGNTLKEGIVEDPGNRERIAKLLRFASTKSEGEERTVSLDDYIARMAEGQDAIWYITADGHRAAAGSPQLERFRAKGELPLDEAEKKRQEEAAQAAAPLLERIRSLLGEAVGEVRVSARLTDSPSCLALSEWEMAPHLAHLLREAGQDVPQRKPTLE